MVMLEQLKTVNQDELGKYIGTVDDEFYMKLINNGLKKGLGVWFYKPYDNFADTRCLCPKCLDDYKYSGKYIVRRVDPFTRIKVKCDKCEGYGYEYRITERVNRSTGGSENV